MQNALPQPLLTTCKYLINQLQLSANQASLKLKTKKTQSLLIPSYYSFSLNIHILSELILSETRNIPDEIQFFAGTLCTAQCT